MAWGGIHTFVTGELVTSATMNTYLSNNLAYLHGDSGAIIALQDGISMVVSGGHVPLQYFVSGEANQRWYIEATTARTLLGPGGATAVDTYANARLAAGVAGGGLVSAGEIMAYHRHPYSNRRHIEAGNLTATSLATMSTTNASLTFTDAFASNVNVTTGVLSAGDTGANTPTASISGGCWISSLSTTGFTLYMRNMSNGTLTLVFCWMAEGID